MSFGNPCGDRAYAHFRYELNANTGSAVSIFEIVNQLGEVFDGVDVMVRRWRNQTYPRGGVADFGDPRIDFLARKLTAFPWFCTLRHFDLNLFCLGEIEASHTKTSRGNLFDGAIFGIALLVCPCIAIGIFAAFACVGFTANAIHGDRKGFVSFLRNRTIAHCPSFEAAQN